MQSESVHSHCISAHVCVASPPAGSIGLRVILVRYSAKADNFYSESSWFITGDAYYTEAQFISDWVMLAKRYVGYAVVGADLWQQPRRSATWGSGASTDWDLAATRAGRKRPRP
jgi:endoglucanase